jgi:hypothetical protein
MTVLASSIQRDQKNAAIAKNLAAQQRLDSAAMQTGAFTLDPRSARFAEMRRKSLDAIHHNPFHVMVEVEVELRNGNEERWVWYGNDRVEVNTPLSGTGAPIVLAWTHPGLQAALASDLNDQEDLYESGLNIVAVMPTRRARFRSTVPEIQGMYEPGGSVGLTATTKVEKKTGLKAVKLEMTREQIRAFTSHMQGVLLITGAPGSGKTTIAYQRVRFLLDQQGEASDLPVSYDQSNTRILLANRNLMHYSQTLLERELGLRRNLVVLVPDFIAGYLEKIWHHKWGAREIQKRMARWEERGRDAVFGLVAEDDLLAIWANYERQVRDRLKIRKNMPWSVLTKKLAQNETSALQSAIVEFSENIVAGEQTPKKSSIRMDRLFSTIHKQYAALRSASGDKVRSKFDAEFAKWLYYVYDPVEAIHSFITKNRYRASTRIDRGIAGRGDAEKLLATIIEDFGKHRYSKADLGMIAFLLRFALPEQIDASKRFKEVATAWPEEQPWAHLVIDEAQDLSAPEAALLASLVDPQGALTISADFRQRVSATHGIETPEPILLGCQIGVTGMRKPFRFAVNKRQTPQISKFLMAYYEVSFGEAPPFDIDHEATQDPPPPPPELFIGDHQHITQRLRQLKNLPSLASGSVAILQINEDPEEREKIEGYLSAIGVQAVPPVNNDDASSSKWIIATVEDIKGLEFDTCFVFGLDGVDAAELDFNKNRAYVGLSRPAHRLVMFCHEFPMLLRGIPSDRYSKKDATK